MTIDRQDKPSSHALQPAPVPRAPHDPFEPVITTIASGDLRRSQDIVGDGLLQAVDLLRPDGSVWRAYQRVVVLPSRGADVARVIREATEILILAAAAVAAAETARAARRAAMRDDAPAWHCTYARRHR